jgi:hypothetical protein
MKTYIRIALSAVNTRFTAKNLIQTRFQNNMINIYIGFSIIVPWDHLKNIIRYQGAINR